MQTASSPGFRGFRQRQSNYSELPHEFIDLLPSLKAATEIKVLIYILRHTWGFQEFDRPKKITIDEFMYGRKREDGSRMDGGTGLSEQGVRDGIAKALEHNYILVTVDSSDKARIEKAYMLNFAEVKDLDPQTLEVKSLDPKSFDLYPPNFRPRSEKETIETNISHGKAPCVVNVKTSQGYDVYIGRANPRYNLPQSKWHNPFKLPKNHSDEQRQQVITQYRERLLGDPVLLAQIPELRGKVLGCWCHPQPCHGDVLLELAALPDEQLQTLVAAAKEKQVNAKPVKARKPDPLFDAVAKHVFGISDTAGMSAAGSTVGAIKAVVKRLCEARATEWGVEEQCAAVEGYVKQCTKQNPVQKWKAGFEPAFLKYLELKLAQPAKTATPPAPAAADMNKRDDSFNIQRAIAAVKMFHASDKPSHRELLDINTRFLTERGYQVKEGGVVIEPELTPVA